MVFHTKENPTEDDINHVRHRLQDYNGPFWEVEERYKYVISLTDEDKYVGGVVFTIFGEWVEIDYFWVDPEQRGKGYGKKILTELERYSTSKGCKMCFLNTFSFQAKPFYEKNGYKIVYTQKNFPITNERYFMEKKL